MVKRSLIIVALACIAILAIACGKSEEEKQQEQAIAAAEKYQDVQVAIAAGYLPTEDCVQSPAGVMGLHYVNPPLIQDPSIDVARPEVLIYQPSASGGVTLVAIEYLFALGPPGSDAPPNPPPAPVLFGVTFNGPENAPAPEVPPHYALHSWFWLENPNGTFAGFNPNGTCG
ncbi:MAG: hypothetical protein IIC83_06310 [Chloroflexi bacterium]|nr:hypothetical protein [Chloroflexota bacterium]